MQSAHMPRFILGTALVAWSALTWAEDLPPLLTGEVYSRSAQDIIVPLTSNWQSRISMMVPEGSFVEQGQVVVEFDGTEAARQLEQQREAARTELAKTERDLARLEKELTQAEFGLEQAQVRLELATLKAGVPLGVIGAIEHAENQLALEETTKALENARVLHDDTLKKVLERTEQAAMDQHKTEIQEKWWAQMLESFVIYARQPGYVVYGLHPWTRAKFQEGDSVRTSFRIAQVADTSELAIKVWINGVDAPRVASGAKVSVFFDALPGQTFSGQIESMSDSGAKRQEWGKADYFEAVVVLDKSPEGGLLPGMSALVEVET
jgi:multidrug resistance efflux pump